MRLSIAFLISTRHVQLNRPPHLTKRGYDLPRNFFADVRQDPEIWSSSHVRNTQLPSHFPLTTLFLTFHLSYAVFFAFERAVSPIEYLRYLRCLNPSQLLSQAPRSPESLHRRSSDR